MEVIRSRPSRPAYLSTTLLSIVLSGMGPFLPWRRIRLCVLVALAPHFGFTNAAEKSALIGERHLLGSLLPDLKRKTIGYIKGVETYLAHELELIGQHIASCAQFAAITQLPDLPGNGIGTAIDKGGEGQNDQREMRQEMGHILRMISVAQQNTK